MSNRNQLLKKAIGETTLDGDAYLVSFTPRSSQVFCAEQIVTLYASFESHVIDGGASLLRWNDLSITAKDTTEGTVFMYVRSSTTSSEVESKEWVGPYINTNIDLSDFTDRYTQFKIVISSQKASPPYVEKATISRIDLSNTENFYLQTIDLDFNPQKIIVSCNYTMDDDTALQFAVAGEDTVDKNKYQIISTNSINNLTDIPELTKKVKLMFMASGKANIPYDVDEFAFIISGNGKRQLNNK
jgi:hypothetical protein